MEVNQLKIQGFINLFCKYMIEVFFFFWKAIFIGLGLLKLYYFQYLVRQYCYVLMGNICFMYVCTYIERIFSIQPLQYLFQIFLHTEIVSSPNQCNSDKFNFPRLEIIFIFIRASREIHSYIRYNSTVIIYRKERAHRKFTDFNDWFMITLCRAFSAVNEAQYMRAENRRSHVDPYKRRTCEKNCPSCMHTHRHIFTLRSRFTRAVPHEHSRKIRSIMLSHDHAAYLSHVHPHAAPPSTNSTRASACKCIHMHKYENAHEDLEMWIHRDRRDGTQVTSPPRHLPPSSPLSAAIPVCSYSSSSSTTQLLIPSSHGSEPLQGKKQEKSGADRFLLGQPSSSPMYSPASPLSPSSSPVRPVLS